MWSIRANASKWEHELMFFNSSDRSAYVTEANMILSLFYVLRIVISISEITRNNPLIHAN